MEAPVPLPTVALALLSGQEHRAQHLFVSILARMVEHVQYQTPVLVHQIGQVIHAQQLYALLPVKMEEHVPLLVYAVVT
jgi:hypothetical protein